MTSLKISKNLELSLSAIDGQLETSIGPRPRLPNASHSGLTVLTQDRREYGAGLLLDSDPSREGAFDRA